MLDTQAGPDAERLYRSMGWRELGTVPSFALTTHGVLTAATYFWKDLRDAAVVATDPWIAPRNRDGTRPI